MPIAAWIVAVSIKENYSKEFACYLPQYDETLAQSYEDFLDEDWAPADVIDTHRDKIAQHADVPVIEKLLDSWR